MNSSLCQSLCWCRNRITISYDKYRSGVGAGARSPKKITEKHLGCGAERARARWSSVLPSQDYMECLASFFGKCTAPPPPPPLLAAREYFDVDTLLESVASGAIRPLRGRWIVEQHRAGKLAKLDRRQDLPDDVFWSTDELRWLALKLGDEFGWLFVALSYRWLSAEHPDRRRLPLEHRRERIGPLPQYGRRQVARRSGRLPVGPDGGVPAARAPRGPHRLCALLGLCGAPPAASDGNRGGAL